jgi:hypothetical protein
MGAARAYLPASFATKQDAAGGGTGRSDVPSFHGQGNHPTFGFPQGRSDYEAEPEAPLGYVGHGFKRFS